MMKTAKVQAPPTLSVTYTEDDGKTETDICTVEKLTDSELIYLTDWGMRYYYEKDIPLPDGNSGAKLLIGAWVQTSDVGYERTASGRTYSYSRAYDVSENFDKHVFKSDGTFDEYEVNAIRLSGTWTYTNGILSLAEGYYEYNVVKLTSSKLVCKYANEYGSNAGFYGEKTFEKIH
jgi:hypothetical protein